MYSFINIGTLQQKTIYNLQKCINNIYIKCIINNYLHNIYYYNSLDLYHIKYFLKQLKQDMFISENNNSAITRFLNYIEYI